MIFEPRRTPAIRFGMLARLIHFNSEPLAEVLMATFASTTAIRPRRCRCVASFLFIVFTLLNVRSVAGLSSDGQLLLQFKAEMQSDPQGILRGWNAADQDPCGWIGVSCSSDAFVIALTLPRCQLHGPLSTHLGALLHLRHLNLHHNLLHGAIPPELFNATQLQSVFLFSNSFSGEVPQEIGKLTQLQSLDLSSNSLAGSIPPSIANCPRLFSLRLSLNSFSGPIPADIGSSLTSLMHLDLSSNLLSDAIPPSLGSLQSLRSTLNLSHNHLSDSIPTSLGSLPMNLRLDLSNNNLSGRIPRNGALAGQGRSAFLENAGLCGAPLPTACSGSPVSSPSPGLQTTRSKGVRRGIIAAIAVGDAAGIALVGLAFLYCFWRRSAASEAPKPSNSSSSPGGASSLGGWFCSRSLPETPGNVEQGELVPLDSQITFDLDDLLKASAYVLGKSGVGIVYKVMLPELIVAVRRLGDGGSHRFKEFQAEAETIGRIRHPNIVSLRAYYWAADEKLLVYDFIPNGSMLSALHGQSLASAEPLLWSSRLKIARGTARGLTYIHEYGSRKFVHGDVKPSNILLDLEMEPYVADFGLNRLLNIAGSGVPIQASRKSGSSQSSLSTLGGPVMSPDSYYQAPDQAAKSSKPAQKWDVYSFGMVLLELLSGKSCLQFASPDIDLVQWIKQAMEEGKPFIQILDPLLVAEMHNRTEEMLGFLKVALGCVEPTPDQRPSMRQVLDSLDKIGSLQ